MIDIPCGIIIIPSAHHGSVVTNTGDEEWQDKPLLQQSREDRIQHVLQCLAPVSHTMVLPLMHPPRYGIGSGHRRWLRDEERLLELLHGRRDFLHLCGQEPYRLGKELPFLCVHML